MFLAITSMLVAILLMLASAVVAFTVRGIKNETRDNRSLELESFAASAGMSFSQKDQHGLLRQLKSFDLFRHERKAWFSTGKISNVMRTMLDDTEIYIFDYSYVISTGKSTRTVLQTVFFANDKNWYLPRFILKPETLWHKFIQLLGFNDIDVAENPEFSGAFWLKGDGKFDDLIRQKFTPEVQELILRRPPAHVEGNNYYMVEYSPNEIIPPHYMKAFLDSFKTLVKRFKTEGKLELLDLAELKKEVVTLTRDEASQ
ncbi:MAG: hypothetical protein JNJ57_14660 [Saprospiraceae bacterium]|nr:hypothetical protein [Saprospiraceae bacterium]